MSEEAAIRSYDDFRKERFFDVPSMETRTSVSRVELPMLFDNTRVRCLYFFIDPARVHSVLRGTGYGVRGTGLVPCIFFNGKCMVNLVYYNYRDVTIGAYDEVTITILVRPEMLRDPKLYLPNLLRKKGESWNGIGAYVLEMPVTIPEARAAGRELWGFPKFETKISSRLAGNEFEFRVEEPANQGWIVEVKGSTGWGIPMSGFDLVTLSNFRDKIWKTIIHTEAKYHTGFLKEIEITAGQSDHRMAKNIRELGLESTRPFIIQATDCLRSRLNHGRALADHPTPTLPYQPPGGDGSAQGIVP